VTVSVSEGTVFHGVYHHHQTGKVRNVMIITCLLYYLFAVNIKQYVLLNIRIQLTNNLATLSQYKLLTFQDITATRIKPIPYNTWQETSAFWLVTHQCETLYC